MKELILPLRERQREQLPFSGTDPFGNTIDVTNRSICFNGTPVFPVTGEFHYARYSADDWERELCKMKAGGVTIVATYVFWIHHEEEEGIWDFSGRRDLRRFVELCQKCGLSVLLRIGPWCHGECRNGGSPDWIALQNSFPIRTDHETYWFYVRRWFLKMEEQVHGLFFKDGGPIIGIQLENEYRAYAEKDHAVRRRYMHKLKQLALDCGFVAPFYTATAWGNATLNEMETLPVLGGYADAAWENHTNELPENAHFLFQPPLNDTTIGCDLKKDDGNYDFDIDINAYPYLTAELGGGMQITRLRRIVIDAKDTEALCVCMMGSGSAMLGYYMYHGGTNPMGKLTTMQEYNPKRESNILPICSYDFQAILRENGDLHESYALTKRHHLFLQAFPWLADAETVIPADSATDPADLSTLRYAIRYRESDGAGFLFFNGHCRKRVLKEHRGMRFRLQVGERTVELPTVELKNDEIKYLPFLLPLGESLLLSANATPLCRLGHRWFFYTDASPEYRFADKPAEIVTLTEVDSRHAYLLADKLWIADCCLYECEGMIHAEFERDTLVRYYGETGGEQSFWLRAETCRSKAELEPVGNGGYRVCMSYAHAEREKDLLLELDYAGDRLEIFADEDSETPVADWFTNGLPLRLSLGSLGMPDTLFVKVYPYQSNRYFDLPTREGQELSAATVHLRDHAVFSPAGRTVAGV